MEAKIDDIVKAPELKGIEAISPEEIVLGVS